VNTILTLLGHERLTTYYRAGYWQRDTIFAIVAAHAVATPDRVAFREAKRTYTYRELAAAADALAGDLAARGVRHGDRVAVWLPSRVEVAIAFLACSRNGYVCCPSLHRDHTVANVVELTVRMGAAAVIFEPGYGADAGRNDLAAALAPSPTLAHAYTLAPSVSAPAAPVSFQLGAVHASDGKTDPDTIVYLAFTSGTTGEPKGVMHSDNTLLANARAIAADWHIDAQSVVYAISPLSHNLGIGAMIMAFAAGAEFVVHDLPKGASLVDRIAGTGATFLVGVPTHAYDLLAELQTRNIAQLGCVHGFRISGAPASPEVVAGLLERGVTPQSGYGMTEAGSHHYTLPDDDSRLVLETSGRACNGYEVRIFDHDDPDRELPIGQEGQIGGRGASLMLGYFDAQFLTEQAFNRSGWFMTGDVGRLDENGYIRVTGRKKDLIIRGGHNIYPAPIEALAMQHDAIERAVAVPIPDERLGERVGIAVMIRPGRQLTPDELLAHLDAAGLSKFDMPEYYLAVDEIPLTASGKIRKIDIVERIRAGELVPTPIRWNEALRTAMR
jgi:acyl-CoA synthetase (AMP-forming)/AMP-acid ligase II